MNLLLRRSQSTGWFGRIRFTLDVRAEFSEEELHRIYHYRLGATPLYQRLAITEAGERLFGPISRRVFNALNLSVDVGDLISGKRIECKDIVEMTAVEDEIREAAGQFKIILESSAHFGGDEVVRL